MSIRIFLVGICWLAVMILIFSTPLSVDHPVYFGLIPARALVHGILFWGFTQIWNVALKKQMKFEVVRDKSFLIVGIAAVVLICLSEITSVIHGMSTQHCYINVLFDLMGCGLGILSFRIVYAGSY